MADFDYSTFLPLIDVLLNGTPQPEYVRTAANRAYYSVYGTLRQRIVNTCGADCFDGQGCHALLVRACREPANSNNLKALGVQLSTLLDLRETADYRWADELQVDRVKSAKTSATRLVGKVNYLSNADLSSLYQALASRPRNR